MRSRTARATMPLFALAAALAPLASCSLAVPLDDYAIDAPDAGRDAPADTAATVCPTGEKVCGAVCRSTFDPEVGCASASCAPCAFIHASVDGCNAAGRCRLGACLAGYADCNGDPDDACEVTLADDPQHCGTCGAACGAPANGAVACARGRCIVTACSAGYADCDGRADDGCEARLANDADHCGACDHPCPAGPNATRACVDGACRIAACTGGFLDCDHDVATGCECGYPHADAACADADAGARCAFGGCHEGFADCNGDLARDGCETDTRTDANACGACGVRCDGGACVAGRCQPVTILNGQGNPGELALDLDYVYWTNYGAGAIRGSLSRVRKDGLNPTRIAGGADASEDSAWGLATSDATSEVFWTTYAAASHVEGALKVGGAAPRALGSTTGRLRGAALDGEWLYVANYEESTILRVNVATAGAAIEVVADGAHAARPNGIAVDANAVYWTNEGAPGTPTSTGAPTSLPSSGSIVAVTKATLGTGTPAFTTLATGQDKPRGLVVDETNVYWTNAGGAANVGAVARIAKDGSAAQVPTVLASALASPREIATCAGAGCAGDPYLYVTAYAAGTILRIRKDAVPGSAPTVIASGQKGPIGIGVDGAHVFWVDYGTGGQADGAVMRLVKQP